MRNIFTQIRKLKNVKLLSAARFAKAFPIAMVLMMVVVGGITLATYTGPNRSTWVSDVNTYWERQHCTYEAWYDPAGTGWYGCHADNYTSPGSGCPGFSNWNNSTCGWPAEAHVDGTSSGSSIEGCSSGQSGCTSRVEDNSYWAVQNPPLVSGVNACSNPGTNGWCKGGASISLSGSDPVYSVTGIEGSAGMLCSGTSSCSWTYPEGVTNLSYWTLSSHGDTSLAGSAVMSLDTVAPTATGISVTGTLGHNNWYRSSVTVSPTGTDATSGVGPVYVQVDGGSLVPNSTSLSAEGTYSITGVVYDVAGNSTALSTPITIGIDNTNPTHTYSPESTPNTSGWYNASVEVEVLVADALSGPYSGSYSLEDPNGAITYGTNTVTVSEEGENTLTIFGTDYAGNTSTPTAHTIRIDVSGPVNTLNPVSGGSVAGIGGAKMAKHILASLTGTITFTGLTTVSLSGVDTVQWSGDNGATWHPVTLVGSNYTGTIDTTIYLGGSHSFLVRSTDKVGNYTDQTINGTVANRSVSIELDDAWMVYQTGALKVSAGDTPTTSASISICDPKKVYECISTDYAPSDIPSSISWDGRFGSHVAPAGSYTVTVTAHDQLGHTATTSAEIIVLPAATPMPTNAIVKLLATSTSTPIAADEGVLRIFSGRATVDGTNVVVGGKSYYLNNESIINEANGQLSTGSLVSGSAYSISGRIVFIRVLGIQAADTDDIVSFKGIVSYWGEAETNGDSWMIVDNIAYKITPSTNIYGDVAEGVYVVGIMQHGAVISLWVYPPDSANSLVQFQGTITEIVGNVDLLPYSITVEGLNYKVTDESVVTGEAVAVGSYVNGSAIGNDRLVLGMEVTSSKPGLWSLALDFFNSTLGVVILVSAALLVIIIFLILFFMKRKKDKDAQEDTVNDAIAKISK